VGEKSSSGINNDIGALRQTMIPCLNNSSKVLARPGHFGDLKWYLVSLNVIYFTETLYFTLIKCFQRNQVLHCGVNTSIVSSPLHLKLFLTIFISVSASKALSCKQNEK